MSIVLRGALHNTERDQAYSILTTDLRKVPIHASFPTVLIENSVGNPAHAREYRLEQPGPERTGDGRSESPRLGSAFARLVCRLRKHVLALA